MSLQRFQEIIIGFEGRLSHVEHEVLVSASDEGDERYEAGLSLVVLIFAEEFQELVSLSKPMLSGR